MTDIQDASYFSLRILSDNQMPKIESEMNKFDPFKADDLEKPIKKGTICAARFKVDNSWYRAKVQKALGKGQFEVEFIDYGNSDTVTYEDMRRLNQTLLSYEPQSKTSQLAFVKVQKAGNEVGEEAAKFL